MKKKFLFIFILASVLSSVFSQTGYYIGDGCKGTSILVSASVLNNGNPDKTDSLVPVMIKKDIVNTLAMYSAMTVIDSDQTATILELQRKSEGNEYSSEDPVEIGKLVHAKNYVTITTDRIGDKYRISFSVVSIESGATISGYTSQNLYGMDAYLVSAPAEASNTLLEQLGVNLSPAGKRMLQSAMLSGNTAVEAADARENLAAIEAELKRVSQEQSRLSKAQTDDIEAQAQKTRLELQKVALLQQQKAEQERAARLEADAKRKQQEEKAAKERNAEQQEAIAKIRQEVESRANTLRTQKTANMSAAQKIALIESEKQLLEKNLKSVEESRNAYTKKIEKQRQEELNKRRSQKPHSRELNPDGSLNDMARKMRDTDLQRINAKYDALLSENKTALSETQDELKARIKSDINELQSKVYTADSFTDDGLYLRVGDYDGNRQGWQYSLSFAMGGKTVIRKNGVLNYKQITGKTEPAVPASNDPDYDKKVREYYAYLDLADAFDSLFRMNIPFLRARMYYTVEDNSSESYSTYRVIVRKLEISNVQNSAVVLTEENQAGKGGDLYAFTPATKMVTSRSLKTLGYGYGMVSVMSGTFTMGDNSLTGADYKRIPEHSVTVGSFFMSATEITQSFYHKVTGKTPWFEGIKEEYKKITEEPASDITWLEAVEFCNLLSERMELTPCYSYKGVTDVKKWSGMGLTLAKSDGIQCDFNADGYRLPTEAEWEFAAKERSSGKYYYKYSGSNNIDDVAWHRSNSTASNGGWQINPVAQKKPNILGLYDMTGNVSEWCWDMMDKKQGYRSCRGGSAADYSTKSDLNVSYRDHGYTIKDKFDFTRQGNVGFRIVSKTGTPANFTARISLLDSEYQSQIASAKLNARRQGRTNAQMIKDLNSFFVKVEGSTFVMGDASTNIGEHKVTLDTFYMMDTEVPQWLYTEIMGNNPSNYQIADNPVEMVDWYDAVEFCNRLSEKNGLTPCYSLKGKTAVKKWGKKSAKWNDIKCDFTANGYRLPTEAEWEYAARGGKSLLNYIYSGSDIIDNVAWTTDNSDFTHSVGLKQANALGIYDMTGNVAEWCWDWHGSYTSEAQVNPKGPETGENKIVRGGGYSFKLYTNNLYFRLYSSIKGNKAIGIRLVRSRL